MIMFYNQRSLMFRGLTVWAVCLLLCIVVAGCDAYGPKPTPAQSSTPKPTEVPAATVGPLSNLSLDKYKVTMLSPSTWAVPQSLGDDSFILSPDGSIDTSRTAGPFLYVVLDAMNALGKRYTFNANLDDPAKQLDEVMSGMNWTAPKFSAAVAYTEAKYPGAIVRGFERGNEITFTLLKAGDKNWILIGVQAPERYYDYYDSTVFTPVINSLALQTP
jgi:hypothetical protein